MLGTASRRRARRSHGSSCRKRSATSNVAPPQHSSEKSSGSSRARYPAAPSMSNVLIRVANSDWCASRNVVSVTATAGWARSAAANAAGSSSRWRDPSGGACEASGGSFSRGSISPAGGSRSRLMVTSVSLVSSREARSAPGSAEIRSGCSSTKVVCTPPARKSGCRSSARRKLWFVLTPRTRSSATARPARAAALRRSGPRAVTLTSSGSKYGETSAPTKAEPSSRRMPAPPGERYAVILPASGRKPFAGFSVVTRHCSAKPRWWIVAWERPRSSSVAPPAIRICARTRSTSVVSSVTVCSTWMRGFISMKNHSLVS